MQSICTFTFAFGFRLSCWGGWQKDRFQKDSLLSVGSGKAFCKEEQSLAAKLPFELHSHTFPCLFFLSPSAKVVAPLGKHTNLIVLKIALPVIATTLRTSQWHNLEVHEVQAFPRNNCACGHTGREQTAGSVVLVCKEARVTLLLRLFVQGLACSLTYCLTLNSRTME